MEELILQVNDYLNATLDNGCNIDGQIFSMDANSFMIDDNITGDIFSVKYNEIAKINEHIH